MEVERMWGGGGDRGGRGEVRQEDKGKGKKSSS